MCYRIFRNCFPQLPLPEDVFNELSDIKSGTLFVHEENNAAVGFVIVKDDCIRLLCVDEQYRGRGIGRKLMKRAEDHIRESGYDTAVLGGFSSSLFIGAPVSREDWYRHSSPFFEKMGYTAKNGCAEMSMDITDFRADKFTLPVPDNVAFDWYKGDISKLRAAVAEVDEDWVRYFDGGSVFCGFADGEIASFCIVEAYDPCILSDGKSRIGAVGCVGTVPRYRKKGIGLKMVSLATEELKKQGFDKCFIHFTAVFDWYARIGYETFLWEWFGRKSLT